MKKFIKLIARAQHYLSRNTSHGLVESYLWSERDSDTSILDITSAITIAQSNLDSIKEQVSKQLASANK